MKIICSKEILLESINIVSKAIPQRSTLPIQLCILIKTEGDNLISLTASDSELTIVNTNEAKIMEEGNIALEGSILADVIRKISDEEIMINIDKTNNNAVISSNNTNTIIPGFIGDTFPEQPAFEGNKKIKIKQSLFKKMIRDTIYAVGIDDNRPTYKGSLFELCNNNFSLVSVDGARIALSTYENEEKNNENISIIVHGRILNEISKILKNNDDYINIEISENKLYINEDRTKIYSSLLTGEFLKYKNSFPKTFTTTVKIKTKDFINSIELTSIVSGIEKKIPIKISVTKGNLTVSSSTNLGSSKQENCVETDGNEITLGFNPRFILDALKVIEEKYTIIKFTSTVGPCILFGENNDNLIALILPLKI